MPYILVHEIFNYFFKYCICLYYKVKSYNLFFSFAFLASKANMTLNA